MTQALHRQVGGRSCPPASGELVSGSLSRATQLEVSNSVMTMMMMMMMMKALVYIYIYIYIEILLSWNPT